LTVETQCLKAGLKILLKMPEKPLRANGNSELEIDLQRRLADFIAQNCPELVQDPNALDFKSQAMRLAGTVLETKTKQDVENQQAAIAHRLAVSEGRTPNTEPQTLMTEGGFSVEGYQLTDTIRNRVRTVLQALKDL